LLKCR